MMGEFIIYYRCKIEGGIYDDRLPDNVDDKEHLCIPVLPIPLWLEIWIAVIILMKVLNITLGFVIHTPPVTQHTILNKVVGILLFLFLFAIPVVDLQNGESYMTELLTGYLYLILYILLLLPGILYIRIKTNIPNELFRKTLHFVFLGIVPLWLYVYTRWQVAVLACIIMVLLFFPILTLVEKIPWSSSFLTERKRGEFKSSLVIVFLMFALVICVCWGIFQDKWLAFASIFAWGPGDAAAALFGKRFGRHKVNLKAVGGKKSYEGTLAMFITSFIFIFIILAIRGGMTGLNYLVIALIGAVVSAVTELFSKNGNDTILCPVSAMTVLLMTVKLLGGL